MKSDRKEHKMETDSDRAWAQYVEETPTGYKVYDNNGTVVKVTKDWRVAMAMAIANYNMAHN
jgi:hypothetical protein